MTQTERPALETPALSSKALRMSYRIKRGEQDVLTFEPYKSMILPYWRFATPDKAHNSSSELRDVFKHFGEKGDFVGMDMTRKFIQMGMTRAARYANHAGGRKYAKKLDGDGKKVQLDRGKETAQMKEKRECSNIFRAVWLECKEDQHYKDLREDFLAEQKEYDAAQHSSSFKSKGSDEHHEGSSKSEGVNMRENEGAPRRSKRIRAA